MLDIKVNLYLFLFKMKTKKMPEKKLQAEIIKNTINLLYRRTFQNLTQSKKDIDSMLRVSPKTGARIIPLMHRI
jgi:hypothetical protein